MRIAGLGCVLAVMAGPAVAVAQPAAGRTGRWVATTERHHAPCLAQAVPEAPMAIHDDGKVATVEVEVAPARCVATVDRLLAYGVREVVIDGVQHALLDLYRKCPATPSSGGRWAISFADFEHAEQRLWDRLERGLDADAGGSTDVEAASWLAAHCRDLVDDVLAPQGIDATVTATHRHYRFTHGAWTGTIDDLGRRQCPRLVAAAARIRTRAATQAALAGARRQLFPLAPEGWFVPRARTPTLAARVLVPARVWIHVEDATLDDLILGHCPVTTPQVTRYTRYRFDHAGAVVEQRSTITCAPFDPARLR